MNDRLIITVAPSIPPYMTKDIPHLDLSPEGIAEEVVRAWNAGANAVHLHVWDEFGQPTTDLTAFKRTIALIKSRCDIILEGSTGGYNDLTPTECSVALDADIELESLNPGSVNYDKGVYINSPADIHYWASTMHARGIKADIAIFEAGMINNSVRLMEQGLLDAPLLFAFVLGQPGAMPATTKNLLFLSESIPAGSSWTAVGHGGSDVQMATLALAMGGHVRAGFEDNPYYRPGEPASSNAQLIERLVRLANEVDRVVATPDEARVILGIESDCTNPTAGLESS